MRAFDLGDFDLEGFWSYCVECVGGWVDGWVCAVVIFNI